MLKSLWQPESCCNFNRSFDLALRMDKRNVQQLDDHLSSVLIITRPPMTCYALGNFLLCWKRFLVHGYYKARVPIRQRRQRGARLGRSRFLSNWGNFSFWCRIIPGKRCNRGAGRVKFNLWKECTARNGQLSFGVENKCGFHWHFRSSYKLVDGWDGMGWVSWGIEHITVFKSASDHLKSIFNTFLDPLSP